MTGRNIFVGHQLTRACYSSEQHRLFHCYRLAVEGCSPLTTRSALRLDLEILCHTHSVPRVFGEVSASSHACHSPSECSTQSSKRSLSSVWQRPEPLLRSLCEPSTQLQIDDMGMALHPEESHPKIRSQSTTTSQNHNLPLTRLVVGQEATHRAH
jgi:hypothetical protein